MRRRDVIRMLGGAAVLWPLATRAQPSRVPRIGVLNPQESTESPAVQREPFERGLRELGWSPGSNVIIEYRYAEGDAKRLTELARELVRMKVDVIVARGAPAIRAAHQATSTIAIVMATDPDPVRSGFVASLAHPGGNITGLSSTAGGSLNDKRMELLKEAIPGLKRVARLINPANNSDPPSAVAAPGVEVQDFEAPDLSTLPEILGAIARARPDALLLPGDPLVLDPHRLDVVRFVRENRLPAIYGWRIYVEAGGLMSYGTSIPAFHYRSASYVDRILRGAKPGDLPIEQPTKFELVVNLKTAEALGLTIPPSLLARADEVIE